MTLPSTAEPVPAIPATRADRPVGGRGRRWAQIPRWIVLSLFAVLFVYPFVWLVSASFKPRAEVFDNRVIPATPTLDNYAEIWRVAPFLKWLGNSVLVGVLDAGTMTITSALVAFGFAYFRFRFKNVLFGLVLAGMMLPAMVTMIPVFLIWKDLGAYGTRLPLWGQGLTASPYYIFLLRQFFLGLPRELFEAARVDGCSYFGLFTRIAVPLARPALIIVFIFEFQASWDDVLKPLIYLNNNTNLFTVPIGLNSLFVQFNPTAGGHGDYQYIVTAALLSTLPLIAIFVAGQRYIVEGLATTARKG